MLAANLHAVGDLRCEKIDVPQLDQNEVLINLKACGICGSDLPRVYSKGTYHFPTVIGHEFSGIVEYDPLDVLNGMRVCVFPLLPCYRCESCKAGQYATCSNYDYYGSRRNGGMAEYLAVKRWNLILLPENVSYDEGAMCEPVSVARHAVKRLGLSGGENLLISGAGPIGIIEGQWAKIYGAKNVYYFDINQKKLEVAEKFGFHEYTSDVRIDCCIEGTGNEKALARCLEAIKPFGKLVLMGNPSKDVNMTPATYWNILRKELTVLGTWNSLYNETENDWIESIKAISEGKIKLLPLITHRYTLDRCNEAFEMMKNSDEFYNKVLIYTEV